MGASDEIPADHSMNTNPKFCLRINRTAFFVSEKMDLPDKNYWLYTALRSLRQRLVYLLQGAEVILHSAFRLAIR